MNTNNFIHQWKENDTQYAIHYDGYDYDLYYYNEAFKQWCSYGQFSDKVGKQLKELKEINRIQAERIKSLVKLFTDRGCDFNCKKDNPKWIPNPKFEGDFDYE